MVEAIGIMEGAFFVPRTEILSWINDLLKLNLTKIEETASGAVACQIMDAMYPGLVPMQKVNWKAKYDYEFVSNYKILQQCFLKQKIQKVIDVEKLIKAKYQDNLEFMQWLKRYYDMRTNGTSTYDPLTRRKPSATPNLRRNTTADRTKSMKENRQIVKTILKQTKDTPKSDKVGSVKKETGREEELERQVELLKTSNKTLQKERDFYFSKLRDLEILVHFYEKGKIPLIGNIEKILYATEDDRVNIDDKGNLTVTDAYTEDNAN